MPYKVGLQTLSYIDEARANWEGTAPRPLLTNIWYPAINDAIETDIFIGPPDAPLFKVGHASRGAIPLSGTFPLILLSHGTGSVALQLGWLASSLATDGYIVAGVNHHGNTALEPYTAQGFVLAWERAKDLSVVLTQLFDDRLFGQHINRQQIGAAGFSLGGYTVIALAGGILDLQVYQEVYRNPERDILRDIPPEFPDPPAIVALLKYLFENDINHKQSVQDKRIRCAFAIAPALGEAFTPAGLATIEIPVKIVVGEADTLAPAETNAMRFAKSIKQAELTILDGQIAHYTFRKV